MKEVMNTQQKGAAYVLMKDETIRGGKNITQGKVADLFGVSQSTVSRSVKEIETTLEINKLREENMELKAENNRLEAHNKD